MSTRITLKVYTCIHFRSLNKVVNILIRFILKQYFLKGIIAFYLNKKIYTKMIKCIISDGPYYYTYPWCSLLIYFNTIVLLLTIQVNK